MINAARPVPRSPQSRFERGHATHSSARHLLSALSFTLHGNLRTPERSHFGDQSASSSLCWGAVGESGVSRKVEARPPAPQLPSPVAAMLPTVRDHGLVEPRSQSGDELCTPTQSCKLAPRIDVGINRAPIEYVAIVKPLRQ